MTHLWLLLFLNSWFKSEARGFGINLIEVPDDDPTQIVCTVALLEKYFHSGEALSGSVLHMSITSTSTGVQQSLLRALHNDPNYPWTIVVKDSNRDSDIKAKTQHVLHEKPQCFFFVVENVEDEFMDEIFESWKSNLNWNPLAQFVVYYSAVQETEEEMTDIMIEILLNFMNKKIYNVNVIGKSEETSFYFGKTVFPYHPDNNCGNRVISIETLDICDYQESEGEEDDEEEEDEEIESEAVNEEEERRQNDNVKNTTTSKKDNEQNPDSNGTRDAVVATTETHNVSQTTTPLNIEYLEDSEDMIQNDSHTDNSIISEYPRLYIEELYRALFMDKFPKDLSGCPLIAAYRPWEPYIFNEALDNSLYTTSSESEDSNSIFYNSTYGGQEEVDEDDYVVYNEQQDIEGEAQGTSSEIRLNGIEYKMIQTIAERLHISIEMQVEANNLYHLFQQLIDGDIEMVVGGIDEDPSISPFASSTIPYHQDELTWCVAKAHNTHNLFNFMTTFQIEAWILTVLFILTASLSISMSQQFLKLPLGFLKSYFSINVHVMGIILSQAINLRPIPTSLKLCFGATFFMGLMFSNIYQSFLVSTLTTPKSLYQISHLSEIYQNRMHIMGSVDNVRHLNKEGEIYRYLREQYQMCYNIEECLHNATKDTKLAVTVSRQHSFYNPRIPRDNLYCFDRNENIYVYLVTMLMPKKFHLLHKINPVIQHIIESGHMQKWARDLDMRRKINEEIQRAREEPFNSLTLSQVVGTFALNGILLLFASWMFAIEHAVYWLVVKRRTRLKLAKYMHRKLV